MKNSIIQFAVRHKATICSVAIIGVLFCLPAFGYDVTFDEGQLAETGLGSEDPASITFAVINAVLVFLGVLTLVLIIYAGFLWMIGSRSGKEAEINNAKKILKGAIIGLVVVLVSYSLSQYIFNTLVGVTTGTE
ncbi:pilin [Patescibacteria group bacterium]|nr:pilin [Patescibacteria group bacterium]MBU1672929.1 pilin [Patescibacteria group bacterium]MBU1963347.1 pilin [Patescibacteria group bacterium]